MSRANRPLGKLSVDLLQLLFVERGAEPSVLAALHDELAKRPLSKTEKLREAVNRSLRSRRPAHRATDWGFEPTEAPGQGGALSSVVFTCSSCSTRLRAPVRNRVGQATCPVCSAAYQIERQADSLVLTPLSQAARAGAKPTRMSVQEARELLGVASSATPEQLQKARKALLQQLHPDKHAGAPARVRELVEAEFKRVDAAYNLLARKPSAS